MDRDWRVYGVAAFFVVVGIGAVGLVVQWLTTKLGDASARIDIAEWPFLIIGLVLALLPLAAALGLAVGRPFGPRLARPTAYLVGTVGAIALLIGLLQLTMGVAWTLLLGGVALIVGAVLALRTIRAARPAVSEQ